jgi:hypothetical protein
MRGGMILVITWDTLQSPAAWFSISEIPANKILAFVNICSVNIKYWQYFGQNYYSRIDLF